MTGTGRYYTAGADFNGLIEPMWPSSLVRIAKERNENLFLMFIDFPKPLIVAINGPAVGAGVTSSACCDYVLSVPEATFWTPFKSLGITPEGCSSVTFPERCGILCFCIFFGCVLQWCSVLSRCRLLLRSVPTDAIMLELPSLCSFFQSIFEVFNHSLPFCNHSLTKIRRGIFDENARKG